MSYPFPELDLVESPFTDAESRLLVSRSDAGLAIDSAEYLRPAGQSPLLRRLVVRHPSGGACAVGRADAAAVELDGGASLVFADATTLSLGLPPGQWEVELDFARNGEGRPLTWRVDGGAVRQTVTDSGGHDVEHISIDDHAGARIVLTTTADRDLPQHAELVLQARARWTAWFDRMPPLRSDLLATGRLAWWVLRANQLRLVHDPSRVMVVPSKLKYVGAWQWDSYFIAAGLRHGAPGLAWDQVEMFLDHQRADGLIPDVVSDAGVLATTEGLPADDPQAHVALHADSTAPAGPIPVTKPPLTAWALAQVNRLDRDPERLIRARSRIAASQSWWANDNDTNGDGLAEYLHPYSSGLDDSPLFDGGMPAEPPDLNSYLVLQDDLLADMADLAGDAESAATHRARAHGRAQRMLDTRWDAAGGRFTAYGAGRPLPVLTPLNLMPLLTGRLPEDVVASLSETMHERLWGERPLPTVAYDDARFDPDRMWRGPVWVNVNRLIAEGLLVSGRRAEARDLAERTLAMVSESDGMYEYWNPYTGERPSSSTTCFAWSAALFVDLAVAVTDDLDLLRAR